MALQFTTGLATDKLLNAYTNNVVEFTSDNANDPFKCVISVDNNSFEITPNQGQFYFNFKTIFKNLIQDGFIDEEVVELSASDPSSFIKDMSQVCKEVTVNYTISFTNGETEVLEQTISILQSVINYSDFKKQNIQSSDTFAILNALDDKSNRNFSLVYFQGYPFDIQAYKKNPGNVKITNRSNGLDYTFNLPNKVNRIFFSDVHTDTTIEYILPLSDRYNHLEFDAGELTTLYLEKRNKCSGHYLKWKNHQGGWSYWLFERKYRSIIGTKDLGYINNDYRNLENSNPIRNIGKQTIQEMEIGSVNIDSKYRRLLSSLLDSPRVYLYLGDAFSRDNDTQWLSVKLLTDDFVLKDYTQRPFDLNVVIELPELNTINL